MIMVDGWGTSPTQPPRSWTARPRPAPGHTARGLGRAARSAAIPAAWLTGYLGGAGLTSANRGLITELMILRRSSKGANALFIALMVSHWMSAQP